MLDHLLMQSGLHNILHDLASRRIMSPSPRSCRRKLGKGKYVNFLLLTLFFVLSSMFGVRHLE